MVWQLCLGIAPAGYKVLHVYSYRPDAELALLKMKRWLGPSASVWLAWTDEPEGEPDRALAAALADDSPVPSLIQCPMCKMETGQWLESLGVYRCLHCIHLW